MKKIFILILFVIVLSAVVLFINFRSSSPKQIEKISQSIQDVITIEDSFTVASAADIVCGTVESAQECKDKETAELIIQRKPQLVLIPGDLQYPKGEYSNFQNFYDTSWGKFKDITYPVPGNHEYETKNAQGYFDYINGENNQSGRAGDREKGYYTFSYGDWHFIAINSNCWAIGGCDARSRQYLEIKKDIENSQKKCTIAYWHHPLFSSGEHGNDSSTKDLWELLYAHNTEVVLNGHDHMYERFEKQDPEGIVNTTKGIREFVVGTGGKDLYKFEEIKKNSVIRRNDTYGVLFLTLKKDSYDWEFVGIDGKVVDKGSDTCH